MIMTMRSEIRLKRKWIFVVTRYRPFHIVHLTVSFEDKSTVASSHTTRTKLIFFKICNGCRFIRKRAERIRLNTKCKNYSRHIRCEKDMTLIKKTIQQYSIFDGILRKEDKRDAGASLCRAVMGKS